MAHNVERSNGDTEGRRTVAARLTAVNYAWATATAERQHWSISHLLDLLVEHQRKADELQQAQTQPRRGKERGGFPQSREMTR